MFERPKSGEKAVIVQLALPHHIAPEEALAEFTELARSADAEIVGIVTGTRTTPESKYFIGMGKADEILEKIKETEAELVLVNHDLSPSQERNLEKHLKCRVVDRSGLILDIFAQRARTFEGKLQVELAQLQHLSTRLVRGWTHLERQKGGIGLRGPGETQLETDRRLLRARIKYINQRLEKVRSNRETNRRARSKSGMPTVSLVGYTNAGKSSLFNALTGEDIYTANQLFATLDPTMRKLNLPGASPVILADTVGFIRELPHHLIEAFKATLEETREADLLLHVIDASDPAWNQHNKEVKAVLKSLDISKDVKTIQVFNKIDRKKGMKPKMNFDCGKVWVSAHTKAGLDYLTEAIITHLFGPPIEEEILISMENSKLRSELYNMKAVISEQVTEDGRWRMKIKTSPQERERLGLVSVQIQNNRL